ncbi:hypothetical protein NDU88_006154 [Pleurodeles waltl]|uniref:Uncharacterized protein n=1 Tax=Pleurodeles waltl TaxID=8319 RepID=A0AAV7QND1_PLEWA|nr:hypothetical protein NDU88_006154 [Pleurodeles waltl]
MSLNSIYHYLPQECTAHPACRIPLIRLGRCDGLAEACPHTFPLCTAAAGGEPEPTEAPPIREKTPGHGGKTEGQEGWRREFQERRSREERRTRNETEEQKNEERDGGAKEDIVERTPGRRTGETRERFVPDQGREDVNPGSGAQRAAILLEKRGFSRCVEAP